ncbi:deoxyribonuclease I [Lentilactobacillus sp. TOM.63]|uniref:endonuclease III domain-containing protein n=1 Tax=Lentilactobacillus TaxID=2767893 RepID=UPI0025A20F49|nr:deoxyribonuclease I [Lentilactobacillus sp. TOM.63]MDM7516591.1 deoxyribonuclease I [Lentilactobacillus sp. TOM.63]
MIDPMPLYHYMLKEMGPQHWWPADSKMEIVIGAILVQNTNWNNVDLALDNLRAKTDLNVEKILQLSQPELEELIRPSGFYKNKSKSLLAVLKWFNQADCDFDKLSAQTGSHLRQTLLALPGIGEETADSLIVYVFDQPTFIADKYARTLFSCLGDPTTNYRQLKQQVALPASFTYQDAQEFHGLIDEFGKVYLKNSEKFNGSFLSQFQLTTIVRSENIDNQR